MSNPRTPSRHLRQRRNWLRPKWYVVQVGDRWVMGSPFPQPPIDDDDPHCTSCGVDCYPDGEGSSRDLESGRLCEDCYDKLPPRPRLSRWWYRHAPSLDNLYFRYAERFGKRVYE